MSKNVAHKFEEAAASRMHGNPAVELYHFFASNKKWWLMPIVIALLFIGSLLLLSTTAVAPFIYTIF